MSHKVYGELAEMEPREMSELELEIDAGNRRAVEDYQMSEKKKDELAGDHDDAAPGDRLITEDQISAILHFFHAMHTVQQGGLNLELVSMLKDLPKAPTVADLHKIATERAEYSKARHVRNCVHCGSFMGGPSDLCKKCLAASLSEVVSDDDDQA